LLITTLLISEFNKQILHIVLIDSAYKALIRIALPIRNVIILACFVVVINAVFSSLITHIKVFREEEIKAIWVVVFYGLMFILLALALYKIKLENIIIYASAEIAIGICSVFVILRGNASPTTIFIGIAGGIYIIIRGLSNLNSELPETGRFRRAFDGLINWLGKSDIRPWRD
jgi:hypothetical protein